MTKIKAYAGSGKFIAIDEASVVDAYRCPWTNNVFVHKDDYVKHLSGIREYKIHKQIRAKNRTKVLNGLWNLESFEEVVDWFKTNPKVVLDCSNHAYWDKNKKLRNEDYRFEITYLNITWNPSVSNSHCCPHNGVENFGRDRKFSNGLPYPVGYPGWQGRIEYLQTHRIGQWSSDVLTPFRIHTGTGGGDGIGRPAGFEVRFFDADWPGLAGVTEKLYEEYSKEAIMYRLQDKYVQPFTPTFRYGQPKFFR